MDLRQAGEELTEMQSIRLALSNYPCRQNSTTKSKAAVIPCHLPPDPFSYLKFLASFTERASTAGSLTRVQRVTTAGWDGVHTVIKTRLCS